MGRDRVLAPATVYSHNQYRKRNFLGILPVFSVSAWRGSWSWSLQEGVKDPIAEILGVLHSHASSPFILQQFVKNKCSSIFFPGKTVSSLVSSASAKQKVGLISLLRHLSPQVSGDLVPLQSQFFTGFKKMKICCFYSLYYKFGTTALFLSLYISELKNT